MVSTSTRNCYKHTNRSIVPEFQPVAPRAGLFGRKPSPEPKDPFALPEIPDDWEPDNISYAEKRAQLIEIAKRTDGFPDASIEQNYHTPEEIEYMAKERKFRLHHAELTLAQDAIRNLYGKDRFSQVSHMEYNAACESLGINKQTGKFNPDPPAGGSGSGNGRPPPQNPPNPPPNDPPGDPPGGTPGGDRPSNWFKLKRKFFGDDKPAEPEETPVDMEKELEMSDSEDERELRRNEAERDRKRAAEKKIEDEEKKVEEEKKRLEDERKRKSGTSPNRRSPRKKKAKP